MKKCFLSTFLVIAMMAAILAGCGSKQNTSQKTIGLVMPDKVSQRWVGDAQNMEEQLEESGYDAEVAFADDAQTQISQIEDFISQNVDCLVIAAVDSTALVDVEQKASEAGIPIIAYDRLLMDTDAVSYYATFDNKGVGSVIANYIKNSYNLDAAQEAGESYTIEFFMGSPDDNNSIYIYNGIMEVLQPYLDSGTLVCKSGKTSFEDTCISGWSQETAKQLCSDYLSQYYSDDKIDIICNANDGYAYASKDALIDAGYDVETDWPLITGQDCELEAVKNIIEGYQAMSVYKDTRLLADRCVTMVNAVLQGTEPKLNDTQQYDNGRIIVPSYLCTPVAVDKENYQEILVDGGYYSAEDF
jgi:putative multiple sugar transport system substrate-binding protein